MFSRTMKAILFCLVFSIPLLFSPSSLTEQGISNQSEQLLSFSKSQTLFRSGYIAYQAKAYNKALVAFRQFITDYPENILLDYAYFYSGMCLMESSLYEEARKMFDRLKTDFPESLLLKDIEFLIADSYYFQEQYDAAIQRYLGLKKDKRYKKHPLLPELYLKLGFCYEQKKQFMSARTIYHQAQFTFISHQIYNIVKEREEKLLVQHPSLQKAITTEELFKDVDKLLKSGKAQDAVPILTALSGTKLSAALQQQVLLKQAQAYYVLRENQRALTLYEQFFTKYPQNKSIPYVLDRIGRLHLRQGDMAAFQKVYNLLRTKYPTSRYTAAAIRLNGKELDFQGKFQEALTEYNTFLKRFPKNSLASDILWNIGWANYRLRHYEDALKAFGRLVRSYPKSYHKEEALYWGGRSAEFLKKYAQAGDYYLKAMNAHRNSYYGFLCRRALEQLQKEHPDLKLSQKPREVKPLQINIPPTYTTKQGILHQQKAQEFVQMQFYSLAAEELAYAIKNDTPDQTKYFELAQLYRQANDYYQLVRVMQNYFWEWIAWGDESLPKEFWELSYPLSFYYVIEWHTSSDELDPLLVIALMFAESVFDPEAYSSAGAMGLMQLMPATGARMANHAGIPPPSLEQYFLPQTNILLGTTYLKELSRFFDGQLLPVIASYNAGERVVSTWWNVTYKDNGLEFVASIPYQETKRYVQKVLWCYREYQRIYRQN
jgi:soluble lytic murein transglycosylase